MMASSDADSLVILLHGVGSNGADLMGLGEYWQQALPATRFISPDAPERLGGGYQWFSVAGVTADNRPARVTDAREGFDATVNRILADEGFAGRLDRVVFVGFSQGTIMALDAMASGRWPVAGVIGFSGRLATVEPLTPAVGTAVLLVHGEADPVIPASESLNAAERLTAHGVSVETMMLPGVGHTISPAGAERAGAMLQALLGVERQN